MTAIGNDSESFSKRQNNYQTSQTSCVPFRFGHRMMENIPSGHPVWPLALCVGCWPSACQVLATRVAGPRRLPLGLTSCFCSHMVANIKHNRQLCCRLFRMSFNTIMMPGGPDWPKWEITNIQKWFENRLQNHKFPQTSNTICFLWYVRKYHT